MQQNGSRPPKPGRKKRNGTTVTLLIVMGVLAAALLLVILIGLSPKQRAGRRVHLGDACFEEMDYDEPAQEETAEAGEAIELEEGQGRLPGSPGHRSEEPEGGRGACARGAPP